MPQKSYNVQLIYKTTNGLQKIQLSTEIDISFVYQKILMGKQFSCKYPDAYFELPDRVVIVQIDEKQNLNNEITECSEIVEFGERYVTCIRYNPGIIRWKAKPFMPKQEERIELLTNVIKDELLRELSKTKLMQLWFDDSLEEYTPCKIQKLD